MARCHFSGEKGRDDDNDDDDGVEVRRSAFLQSTFHLFTQQLAKSSGSVAVTPVQNLSDCSRHFLQNLILCTLLSVSSPSWILADSFDHSSKHLLYFDIPRWHYSPVKVQDLNAHTPLPALTGYLGVLWFILSQWKPLCVCVAKQRYLPSCLKVTTLPFPTIHQAVSVRIRCSVTTVAESKGLSNSVHNLGIT